MTLRGAAAPGLALFGEHEVARTGPTASTGVGRREVCAARARGFVEVADDVFDLRPLRGVVGKDAAFDLHELREKAETGGFDGLLRLANRGQSIGHEHGVDDDADGVVDGVTQGLQTREKGRGGGVFEMQTRRHHAQSAARHR